MVSLRAPFSRLARATVFAVDSTSCQLMIESDLAEVDIDIGGRTLSFSTRSGVCVVDIDGLEPSTSYVASVSGLEQPLRFTTRPDFGQTLARFATVSDIHIGLEHFGIVPRLTDEQPGQTLRCAQAAVRAAASWGAETIVIKGDVTEDGATDQWDQAPEIIAGLPSTVEVLATAGNHDVKKTADVEPRSAIDRFASPYERVQIRELPGALLMLLDTTIMGSGHGRLAPEDIERVMEAAKASSEPAFIGIHHHFQRTTIPWFWPPGILPKYWKPFVKQLEQRNAPTLVSSGHTHRNRVHYLGTDRNVVFTEVSSTGDFPGVWAGYEVTTQGIRQTTRRIDGELAIRWTQRTKTAIGGVWPRWSIGTLDDRCVDLSTPPTRSAPFG